MTIEILDQSLFELIHYQLKNSVFTFCALIFRSKYTWIPLYLSVAYYMYQKMGKTRMLLYFLIFNALVIVISDVSCAQLLKPLIGRSRPCFLYAHMSWYTDYNLCSQTFSFPSCHATNHSALAAYWYRFISNQYAKLGLIIWPLCISWAQVYVGVHFPTDVLAGITIGLVIGTSIAIMANRYISSKDL